MSIQRKLNEKLFLNLQLFDGEASLPKRVFVNLRDGNNNIIAAPFEIFHVSGGEFRENTEVMPNVDTVHAQYFVYEADGVTLDSAYSVGKDVYMRDFSAEIIDTNLDAKVSSISGGGSGNIAAAIIEGEISEDETLESHLLGDESLEGSLPEEETIVGEIEEEDDYVC